MLSVPNLALMIVFIHALADVSLMQWPVCTYANYIGLREAGVTNDCPSDQDVMQTTTKQHSALACFTGQITNRRKCNLSRPAISLWQSLQWKGNQSLS